MTSGPGANVNTTISYIKIGFSLLTMTVFAVAPAVNVALFALAVVAVAVGALHDASRTLCVVVTVVAVSGLGILEQVAEDEEDSADEERKGFHVPSV